jgi:hypothetical protein
MALPNCGARWCSTKTPLPPGGWFPAFWVNRGLQPPGGFLIKAVPAGIFSAKLFQKNLKPLIGKRPETIKRLPALTKSAFVARLT